jgi:hypothetical protein
MAGKWVEIYQQALLELGDAKMRGRIGDARAAIRSRVEKLKDLPGLHSTEYQSIEDALSALRFLEREEDRYDENSAPGNFRSCLSQDSIPRTQD